MFIVNDKYRPDDSVKEHNYLGIIVWYSIFVVIMPLVIIKFFGFRKMMYYLPVIDLIANILSVSGSSNMRFFKDVYSLNPNTIVKFLSTNFINLLALVGVSWNGIHIALKKNDIMIGVTVTIIMYVVTYLLPTQGTHFMVYHIQKRVDKLMGIQYDENRVDIYGYFGGLIFLIVMYFTEFCLIKHYIKFMENVG